MKIECRDCEPDARYEAWVKCHRRAWMTDGQWDCALLLCRLFGGFHHVSTHLIKPISDTGIKYLIGENLATFDSDGLTRLVLLAHEMCIRADITACNPQYIKLCLFKRHGREGECWLRHPTIETVLQTRKGK